MSRVEEIENSIAALEPELDTVVAHSKKRGKDVDERARFFQAQLNTISTQLNEIERSVKFGLQLNEAEEGLARLDQLDQGAKYLDVKVSLLIVALNDVRTQFEKMQEALDNKATSQQLEVTVKRIESLEKVYGDYLTSKNKKILLNLVDVVNLVGKRVDALEDTLNKSTELYITALSKEMNQKDLLKNKPKVAGDEKKAVDSIIRKLNKLFGKR